MATKSKKAVKKAAKKAVKTATKKTVTKAAKKVVKKAALPKPATRAALSAVTGATRHAIITVTFSGVNAGNSEITATLNEQKKTLTSSGTITFTGVQQDDIIGIDGSSPGSAKVEINIDATPTEMNFTGNFNDNFVIN